MYRKHREHVLPESNSNDAEVMETMICSLRQMYHILWMHYLETLKKLEWGVIKPGQEMDFQSLNLYHIEVVCHPEKCLKLEGFINVI